MKRKSFAFNNKKYRVDYQGFLIDPNDWDEDFAEGMAPKVKIEGGLTEEHWRIIKFVRNTFDKMSHCPLVYVACKHNDLGLGDLRRLFPTGYLRGVCKLAGITYREVDFQQNWLEDNLKMHEYTYENKVYRTDEQGFLLNPDDWDENFALSNAYKLHMKDYLTERHWKIISYLRNAFKETGVVPNVYEVCDHNDISIETLEELFPQGYHRGAVKIAGLRVR